MPITLQIYIFFNYAQFFCTKFMSFIKKHQQAHLLFFNYALSTTGTWRIYMHYQGILLCLLLLFSSKNFSFKDHQLFFTDRHLF